MDVRVRHAVAEARRIAEEREALQREALRTPVAILQIDALFADGRQTLVGRGPRRVAEIVIGRRTRRGTRRSE